MGEVSNFEFHSSLELFTTIMLMVSPRCSPTNSGYILFVLIKICPFCERESWLLGCYYETECSGYIIWRSSTDLEEKNPTNFPASPVCPFFSSLCNYSFSVFHIVRVRADSWLHTQQSHISRRAVHTTLELLTTLCFSLH